MTPERRVVFFQMVEAAGVEPASENIPYGHLHAYPDIWFSSFRVSIRQDSGKTILLEVRQRCNRHSESAILLVDVLAGSAGKTRQDGSTKLLRRSYNHLRLYLGPAFLRVGRNSACNQNFFIPVEAVSPPINSRYEKEPLPVI